MKKSLLFPPLRGETIFISSGESPKKRKERKGKPDSGCGCAFSSKTSDSADSITEQAHDKTLTSLIPVPAALLTGPNGNPALEDENTHLEEKKQRVKLRLPQRRGLLHAELLGVYI